MIIEIIKALFFGIVEGVTEWMPVSSTGHLLLFNAFFPMNQSDAFRDMLLEFVQLSAIIAVIVIFFSRLWPFSSKKSTEEKKNTWFLLFKIVVASIPGTIAVVIFKIFDIDFPESGKLCAIIVSVALFVYGIAFIIIERANKNKVMKVQYSDDITFKLAFLIGCFQVFSIIPGTSRSGSTILGSILLGVSRTAAADFSFFLAIPATAGASGIKVLEFIKELIDGTSGVVFGAEQITVMAVASVVSFLVSLAAVKFLMKFVKKHSFEAFGWYRIILGLIIFVYFSFIAQ